MTTGLLILASNSSAQNKYINKSPQITFFKMVYKRHTNFSFEQTKHYFDDVPDFGTNVTAIISKIGDMLNKCYLVVKLPAVPKFNDNITRFAWKRKIGFRIIEKMNLEIGGQIIDSIYGEWMNIWYQLTTSKDIDSLIGNVRELYEFTDGKSEYKLIVPLNFFFNKNMGLALPLLSIQDKVKINLQLNELSDCYEISPTNYVNVENDIINLKRGELMYQDKIMAEYVHYDIFKKRLYFRKLDNMVFTCGSNIYASKNKLAIKMMDDSSVRTHKIKEVNNLVIKKCYLLADIIYLDNSERERIYKEPLVYLIEQCNYNGESIMTSMNQTVRLNIHNHSCKELYWVAQLPGSDKYDYSTRDGKNIILSSVILLNNKERLTISDSDYYSKLQVYQNHSNGPQTHINTYSFGLEPESYQPKGTINFDIIDSIKLRLTIRPNLGNPVKIRVYGLYYNVYKVGYGISGTIYKN